eukprot:1085256-Rhodomonas_salina.3
MSGTEVGIEPLRPRCDAEWSQRCVRVAKTEPELRLVNCAAESKTNSCDLRTLCTRNAAASHTLLPDVHIRILLYSPYWEVDLGSEWTVQEVVVWGEILSQGPSGYPALVSQP